LDFANVVDVWRIESKDPQNLRGMCFACKYDVCMIGGWIGDVCFQASWQPLTKSLRPWVLVGCKEPPLPLTIDLWEKTILRSQSRHLSVPNVFDFALWYLKSFPSCSRFSNYHLKEGVKAIAAYIHLK
jgi:hypothetical protein